METNAPPKILIGIKDAALTLSVSPWTLRRWVSQARIPYVKLGKKAVRFRPAELEKWAGKHGRKDKSIFPLRSLREAVHENQTQNH